jgi:beta-N-acetylhexosaminidase
MDFRMSSEPTEAEIRGARDAVTDARLAIIVTLATNVQPGQARLVEAVLSTGTPTVTVAMRTPYDLADYPAAGTHLCTYSIVPASVDALADALFGGAPISGRLPVEIPGLYPRVHGMEVQRWP